MKPDNVQRSGCHDAETLSFKGRILCLLSNAETTDGGARLGQLNCRRQFAANLVAQWGHVSVFSTFNNNGPFWVFLHLF